MEERSIFFPESYQRMCAPKDPRQMLRKLRISSLGRRGFRWEFLDQLGNRFVNPVQRFLLILDVQFFRNRTIPDDLVGASVNELQLQGPLVERRNS